MNLSHETRDTLAYDVGPVEPALLETTISDNLRLTVEEHGEREALVDVHHGRRWTYAEFRRDVRRLATGLHRAGVRTGQRVGLWSPNRWEWTLTQYATAELGAIMVTINPAYRQHELNHVLGQAGITVVIASDVVRGQDYPAMLRAAEQELGALELRVILGSPEWEELMVPEPDEETLAAVAAGLDPGDPINIQYTSGTTGFPKGATLTHRNILNNGFFVGETCRYTARDRICIPVPFYHCFGMAMGNLGATTHGAAMVIPAPTFDPRITLQTVQDERCTSLYGVPTMFIAELGLEDRDSFDLSSLRTGIMAGSSCPQEIMRQVIEVMHMEEVTICYGMTETSPVSLQTHVNDELGRRVGTVGRAGPHVEVKVVDPVSGVTLPVDRDGELCTRGYLVMQGYWDQPDRTAEAVDAEGWMHTGDMARMDSAGYVQITGRMKDMVIRGGENIYPREIEEFLYSHPDIVDVQVIGVPDEKYGEELMAWVRLRDGAEPLTVTALRGFCHGRLARYKIPRYVTVVDEFPTTVTGKVRKVQMRDEALDLLATPGAVDDARAD
ncbi:AMP-binding protein [Nesterenkonia xinjiangensis]|uniref:Fatty-acyl-CoA synthase n=1 Tax=Nesterenkonia xinjiangensis TaxID=225327 RepID=A0A7Z0GJC3_9MICC|nr:AMP-binding protein [Nesterenkonia xinjiangensis]NYJ77050.1 fatty-acyl-CoA synthase [Nesterenkonia xinjiangensis]